MKAKPHETIYKIFMLAHSLWLLRPVFAMPQLNFFKESASAYPNYAIKLGMVQNEQTKKVIILSR